MSEKIMIPAQNVWLGVYSSLITHHFNFLCVE